MCQQIIIVVAQVTSHGSRHCLYMLAMACGSHVMMHHLSTVMVHYVQLLLVLDHGLASVLINAYYVIDIEH